jgi:polyhydroxyalkanoate synthesis regulator phasin
LNVLVEVPINSGSIKHRSLGPGPALHRICERVIDLLVKEGSLTIENAKQLKADLWKQVSEVG